jgi:hypothetical protein
LGIYDSKATNPGQVYSSTTLLVGIAKGACALNPGYKEANPVPNCDCPYLTSTYNACCVDTNTYTSDANLALGLNPGYKYVGLGGYRFLPEFYFNLKTSRFNRPTRSNPYWIN